VDLREGWEARLARDAAFGGSKSFEKADAVGNGGAVKLGIATIWSVFGTSEASGVRD
jgi:hypothetical protein